MDKLHVHDVPHQDRTWNILQIASRLSMKLLLKQITYPGPSSESIKFTSQHMISKYANTHGQTALIHHPQDIFSSTAGVRRWQMLVKKIVIHLDITGI